jgi:putative membrane protein
MGSLLTYWHLDFLMAVFLAGICLSYFYLTGFKIVKKSVYFFAGLLLIILSVASPLHFLGENYLMSAHMASHVILLLIASPLLVLGIPETRDKNLRRFSETLVRIPWLPWMSGVCIMWFWHIPVIFNHLFDTQEKLPAGGFLNSLYFLQNLHLISLIVCGIIFSWPLIGPVPSRRIAPLNAVLYLSGACIFCSILGLLITFAPMGVYTPYAYLRDHYGFLNMIRNENGISALVDQQAGGLIMWVPGCLIYLTASMYLLMKWFKERNVGAPLSNQQISHDRKQI